MAIDSVTSAGPPGALALLQLQARQPAQSAATAPISRTEDTNATGIQTGPAAVASDPAKTPSVQPSRTDIEDAVTKVQKVVEAQASNLLFSIDDDSGKTVVKVVDSSTKETIRQIPSEEILSIAKALDKLQGLLLRQTA